MSNIPLPPAEMNFVGDGDFSAIGEHFLEHFIKVGGLKPHHRVLDIGSGIGRMALPLTRYLNQEGSYEGFDLVDVGVQWCQNNITPKFPNFRFQVADVFNRGYNPGGTYLASNFRFPFPGDFFDFVFLTSVFTHMMPLEVENYLSEIARVLKLEGRCLATCFLHNAESAALMSQRKSHIRFDTWLKEGCWVANPELPEDAVCFAEEYMIRQFERFGLAIDPVYHGAWSGRENTLTAHDVIVATKKQALSLGVKLMGNRLLTALGRVVKPQLKPHGYWRGATESGVTRARTYVSTHPDAIKADEQ